MLITQPLKLTAMKSSNIHRLLICDVSSSMVSKHTFLRKLTEKLPNITVSEAEYNEYKQEYVLVVYNSASRKISVIGKDYSGIKPRQQTLKYHLLRTCL